MKIEFDDGSRVVSQTLEEAAGAVDVRGNVVRRGERRPRSCSLDDYYEVGSVTSLQHSARLNKLG